MRKAMPEHCMAWHGFRSCSRVMLNTETKQAKLFKKAEDDNKEVSKEEEEENKEKVRHGSQMDKISL